MSVYTVHVSRGDTHWLVFVPQVERTTQARNLRTVDSMARDLIAVMDDVDPDSVELDVEVEIPEAAGGAVAPLRRAARPATQLKARAAAEAGAAARALRELGITVRVIGAVLQVSYQRADQLLRQGLDPQEAT